MTSTRNTLTHLARTALGLGLLAFCLIGCGGTGRLIEDVAMPAPDTPIDHPHGGGLALPGAGRLYHGVFPGDDESSGDAEENAVTPATLASYERAVRKSAAWVYFSHNWYQGRAFPLPTATWIRRHGSLPFIRLMLRSSAAQDVAEPLFTPARIAAGEFDADLEAWGRAAAAFETPLLVEYGTEVNGSWFSWNGAWNGGAGTGPAAFRQAYRHIVDVVSRQGASNVTWVFHVAQYDVPDEAWNRFEAYYPGDDVVDWIGVSIYGAETPQDDEWLEFASVMNGIYPRLVAMAPGKPVAVLEMGVPGGNPLGRAATWARAALSGLKAGLWPAVVGFSWWNEGWQNDSNPAHDTDMRVQTVNGLADAVAAEIASPNVLGAPILTP